MSLFHFVIFNHLAVGVAILTTFFCYICIFATQNHKFLVHSLVVSNPFNLDLNKTFISIFCFRDQRILELLYEEARHNILESRYPCEVAHYIMLGGIQAGIELGAYNPQIHSTHYFREEQAKYLPMHVRKSATWTWLPISSKNSAEVRLLEQFKRIPISATNRKLMRKYLEFCWSLPFYGWVTLWTLNIMLSFKILICVVQCFTTAECRVIYWSFFVL